MTTKKFKTNPYEITGTLSRKTQVRIAHEKKSMQGTRIKREKSKTKRSRF